MADTATPPADPAATATPPAAGADPAPAPSDATSAAAKTLLTQGDAPPADPAAKPPGDAAKPADPAATVVLPEKYTLPVAEGGKGIDGLSDALSPVFRELNLTQEQVNKIGEAYNKFGAEFTKANEAKEKADFDTWMSEQAKTNTDAIRKEWGTEFDGNLKVAQRAIGRFAPPELKSLLDETGMGNHPAFLKAFLQIGKMIQEDTPPTGQQPATRKSNEDVFYGGSAAA